MSVGIVMLVHTALNRATQVARYWAAAGCPVVIHVDKTVPRHTHDAFVASLSDHPEIRFCDRYRCDWGTWGITAATQTASAMMLANHPEVQHVYLVSGSCLPLRPVQELQDYLKDHPEADFIESVAVSDVPWTVGGLDRERFTLYFRWSWRRQRYLFDKSVELQRKLKVDRPIPKGLVPHLGSQWWCLSRQTLTAILEDPQRPKYDRYFRRVWIPDESYFQSLVRLHSKTLQSRSLTLSKFDFQGKPHVFYDDHLQLLRNSDAFVARKIWPYADLLYDTFLNNAAGIMARAEPDPAQIDKVFGDALKRRTKGRAGLYMQSRFPKGHWDTKMTAAPYTVCHGLSDLFEDFQPWLAQVRDNLQVHGHLFHKKKIEYAGGASGMKGALTSSVPLRNYNAKAFLTNLMWNTKGERQCFQFGPGDNQRSRSIIAKDERAHMVVITGAWAVGLFHADMPVVKKRERASDLQRIESAHLKLLRSSNTKARVHVWTLADAVANPLAPLQEIVKEIGGEDLTSDSNLPQMVNLEGFSDFLRDLINEGLRPYLVGDFQQDSVAPAIPKDPPKPYLVR